MCSRVMFRYCSLVWTWLSKICVLFWNLRHGCTVAHIYAVCSLFFCVSVHEHVFSLQSGLWTAHCGHMEATTEHGSIVFINWFYLLFNPAFAFDAPVMEIQLLPCAHGDLQQKSKFPPFPPSAAGWCWWSIWWGSWRESWKRSTANRWGEWREWNEP